MVEVWQTVRMTNEKQAQGQTGGPARGIEVIARGVFIREGHVLMCVDVAGGYSYLPGGHVEPGEAAARAVERELLEETGWEAEVGGFLFAAEHRFEQASRKKVGRVMQKHEVNLVFHVERLIVPDGVAADVAGDPGLLRVPSAEVGLEFRWVELAAAVDLDIRPASVRAWLATGAARLSPAWVSE